MKGGRIQLDKYQEESPTIPQHEKKLIGVEEEELNTPINKKISGVYYDGNYFSAYKLYRIVKEKYPEVKYKDITDFLEKQYTYQVNRQTKKPKEYNTIYVRNNHDNYQIDILVYDRYEINRYKYILVVIDVNSRYVQARAMTNRTNETILKNLENIFSVMKVPKNINCDNEFNTTQLNEFFKKHKITMHYSDVGEINKNAIVERFNRTLAGLFQKWRVATNQKLWYKELPNIIDKYNNSYHSTIKAKPIDVLEGRDENHQHITHVNPNFKVGDIVRIKEEKPILGKGDYLKYSEDTYIITKKYGQKFKLQDTETEKELSRYYKEYELKKISDIVETSDKPIPEEIITEEKPDRKLQKVLRELESINLKNIQPTNVKRRQS